MRIIDKNTDFYDYLQNVYRDATLTFDRTDSFLLTKKEMCDYLNMGIHVNKLCFCLLQVCNTFWLFLIEVTKTVSESNDMPTDYEVELLSTWKNYSKQRALCKLDLIRFDWTITRNLRVSQLSKMCGSKHVYGYDTAGIVEKTSILVDAVNTNNYEVKRSINKHTVYLDGWRLDKDNRRIEKHLPLLKASGLAGCIDPQEIYLSFEEYFSLEKTDSERTESIGITDKEKIENHGFDVKASFRGK